VNPNLFRLIIQPGAELSRGDMACWNLSCPGMAKDAGVFNIAQNEARLCLDRPGSAGIRNGYKI
jgi:hypothetical protein